MARLIGLLIIGVMLLSGCAQMFTAKTTVHFEYRAVDGSVCIGDYESDKEQIGLEATICGGAKIKVAKSSTQEEVIAATLDLNKQVLQFLREQAAKGGAS